MCFVQRGQLEGNPNSVFAATLPHCMTLQKVGSTVLPCPTVLTPCRLGIRQSTHPTLDVPRILPMLIDAVKQQGGFQTEGIFRSVATGLALLLPCSADHPLLCRVSAAKTAVDELQAQLEKGNYDVKFSSPHEPSNLLKQWCVGKLVFFLRCSLNVRACWC